MTMVFEQGICALPACALGCGGCRGTDQFRMAFFCAGKEVNEGDLRAHVMLMRSVEHTHISLQWTRGGDVDGWM